MLFCLLYCAVQVTAQVQNEDCSSVFQLGTAPYCQNTIFNNVGASDYDIGFDNNPSCFIDTPPKGDVWFSFQVAADIIDYSITIEGIQSSQNTLTNIQAAIYRGFCAPNVLALRDCSVSPSSESTLQFNIFGATPNETLYLRISNFGGASLQGDFSICIQEDLNEFTIDQQTSNACKGILYDTGGSTNNYSSGENHIFTICPSEIHQCIRFDLEYYNIEEGTTASGDKLTFYNGDNTSAEVISVIGQDSGYDSAYGGGGVCYTAYADDCMTLQFQSDNTVEFEGFKGTWSCSVLPCEDADPLFINENAGESTIIDAISSPLTKVTIDTIICANNAYGTFELADESLGLEKGLILTTGNILNALGPNNLEDAGSLNGLPGDPDLDILSELFGNATKSNDACVIELDVFTISNELTFEYIFGSEEYPEFVNTEFNDIFSLLISGPGITDGIPDIGGQKNMAILPSNGLPVEINTVNPTDNYNFYRNNAFGQVTEYDGMTTGELGVKKSLTARQDVLPCNTYHLKFAIADRGDGDYDSGVFIGEISSGLPTFRTAFATNVDFIIEGCGNNSNQLVIEIDEPATERRVYRVVISGSAIRDEDYTSNIMNEVIFLPGESFKTFDITSLVDEVNEPEENIIIELISDSPCGQFTVDTIQIPIREKIDLELQDQIQVCENATVEIEVNGASDYTWTSEGNIDSPNTNIIPVFGDQDRWYFVTGSIGMIDSPDCVDTDSIFVDVITPTIDIVDPSQTQLCIQDSIDLKLRMSHPTENILWFTDNGDFSNTNLAESVYFPKNGADVSSIFIQQNVAGCTILDTLQINVDDFHFPSFLTRDTICQGTLLTLGTPDPYQTGVYSWTPQTGILTDTNTSQIIVSPNENVQYELTGQSERNYCEQQATIDIIILPNDVDIQAEPSLNLCLGQSITLSSTISSVIPNPIMSWFVDGELVAEDANEYMYTPAQSSYVSAFFENESCVGLDSVFVQVDSLPILEIQVFPEMDSFCKGDVVLFESSTFEPFLYPNINFNWTENAQINTPLSNANLGVVADKTTTFERVSTNGGCIRTDTISIDIIDATPQILWPNVIIPDGEIVIDRSFTFAMKNADSDCVSAIFESIDFRIFNRWGNTVFECDNINCAMDGWNGFYKNNRVPAEVYHYFFNAIWSNGETVSDKGSFTLLR